MKKYTHMVMEIVGGCNARCKYCTTGIANLSGNSHIETISVENFTKGLDYILNHDFFDKEHGQLELFNWGEPFLHKDLNEICRQICERKICYRLSTNGSVLQLLDKENLAYLDDVCISISGFTKKSYRKIHGLELKHVLSNVKAMSDWFQECGVANKLVMNFHVYQFNIGEVEAAARFCKKNGIVFLPHIAYLADFDLFNRFMLKDMDMETLYGVSKELLMGAVDELMENYSPSYECKQRNSLVLDEKLHVLPCSFLTSRDHMGYLFDYADVEQLETLRDHVKACDICRKSKTCFWSIRTSILILDIGLIKLFLPRRTSILMMVMDSLRLILYMTRRE